MNEQQKDLYEKTTKRLARVGVKDPTAQIVFLAEEIDRYRAKIYSLEAHIRGLPPLEERQDALLLAALTRVAQEYERAKQLDCVKHPLPWAMYQAWKQIDGLEKETKK